MDCAGRLNNQQVLYPCLHKKKDGMTPVTGVSSARGCMQLQDFMSFQLAILLMAVTLLCDLPRLPEPVMALTVLLNHPARLILVRMTCAREDFIGDFSATSAQQDCDGHGTHTSSIAVGRSVGVAKEANVVGVRVLNCNGTGQSGTLVSQRLPLFLGCDLKFA
jgi:hypothetical protein